MLEGELWPPLLTALTRYSRREPVGSVFRAISLFIAELIWHHGPKARKNRDSHLFYLPILM